MIGGGGFGPGWGGGGWNGGGGIGLGNLNAGQQIITLPPPPIILQQRTPDIFSPFPGFGGFGGLQVLPINGGGFFGAQQFGGGGCPNCGPQIRPAQGLQAASGRPPAGYINLTSYWKRW